VGMQASCSGQQFAFGGEGNLSCTSTLHRENPD
jgi:hypothetical protein